MHCTGCDACALAYCGLVGALALWIGYVHFVLWPRWYPTHIEPAAAAAPEPDTSAVLPVPIEAAADLNPSATDPDRVTRMRPVAVAATDVDL